MSDITEPDDSRIKAWADGLMELEGQINDLQGSKKDTYTVIREDHGRMTADALKNAVRILRMDVEKRAKNLDLDAETVRLLAIIEGSRAHGAPAPHATAKTVPTRQITHQPIEPVEKKARKPKAEVLPPDNANGSGKASWLNMLPVKA